MKNKKPITIPLSSEVVTMLDKLPKNDKPVFSTTNFRKSWERACSKIGRGQQTAVRAPGKKVWYKYVGLLPHDFRRSADRNFITAGVPQAVAKAVTGHKTDSMFSRYNIVSVAQQHDAKQKVTAAAAEKIQTLSASR